MRPIDADALIKEYEEILKTLADFCVLERMMCREVIRALQNAPTIEPSEQYKKGFEDAKRAFELEYARESENMRKRNAELEVMLNSYREISAEPCKSTDQNVADVPIDDLVSRADVLALINKAMFSIDNRGMQDYIFNGLRRKVHNLPSADVVSREDYYNLLMASNDIDRALREYQAKEEADADRQKGEWKWTHGGQCSECGFHNTNFDFNFCPNCGADMRPKK